MTQHLPDVQGLLSAAFVSYGPDGQAASSRSFAMGPQGVELASSEQFTRSLASRLATRKTRTAAGDVTRTQQWDAVGRPTSFIGSADESLTITYPSATTRVISQRGPDGLPIITTEELDDFGGLKRQVDAQGARLAERIVDSFGRPTREFGPGGDQVDISYNPWSQVSSSTQSAAGVPKSALLERKHEYDTRGRLTAVKLGTVVTATYAYDALGRVARETRAGRDTLTHYVDASNEVLSQTLPSGRVLRYEYNDPRKLLSAVVADASAASDVVGPAQQRLEFVYDAVGALQQATVRAGGTSTWTTQMGHDGLGRLRSESAGSLPAVAMDYGMGLAMTRQTIGSQTFDFGRLPDGRLQGITNPTLGKMLSAKEVTYGAGTVDRRSFDDRGRITTWAGGLLGKR